MMNSLYSVSKMQLVTHMLLVSLITQDDEEHHFCCLSVDWFTDGLTDDQLETCKAEALQMASGRMGEVTA